MYGGTTTYMPLKVNMAGVIPVIFASSLLYIPTLADQFSASRRPVWFWVNNNFSKGDHPLYMLGYFAADHLLHVLLRRDHVQPGRGRRQHEEVRRVHPWHPGRPADGGVPRTTCLTRITFPGSLYLTMVALIPTRRVVAAQRGRRTSPSAAPSMLIMVGVGLETVKQIESQLQQRNYEGFLR